MPGGDTIGNTSPVISANCTARSSIRPKLPGGFVNVSKYIRTWSPVFLSFGRMFKSIIFPPFILIVSKYHTRLNPVWCMRVLNPEKTSLQHLYNPAILFPLAQYLWKYQIQSQSMFACQTVVP